MTSTTAQVISAAPGSKVAPHLHPDSPEYWVIQEGRIRFEIENPPGKFHTFEAGKGALVFAPERHLHLLEVIGSEPAIRFTVTLPDATPVFETKIEQPGKGIESLPVTLSTGNNPDDVPNPKENRPIVFHLRGYGKGGIPAGDRGANWPFERIALMRISFPATPRTSSRDLEIADISTIFPRCGSSSRASYDLRSRALIPSWPVKEISFTLPLGAGIFLFHTVTGLPAGWP